MILPFSVTIFLGAFLLFAVQPMAAKMLLPLLGGTPQVWNTCMFFFQTTLLAGYAYCHLLCRYLRLRFQILLHLTLVLLALTALPLDMTSAAPPAGGSPVFWLLKTLCLHLGGVFLLISANSPLIQKWFSRTSHPDAQDPYFLYGASNLGSLAALLAYPFVIEPWLNLSGQSRLWSGGYLGLILSLLFCAFYLRPSAEAPAALPDKPVSLRRRRSEDDPLSRGQRFKWVFLSFVPVSLMYGVTTFISTDIAPFPLLWILPLSLYLITFIIAFSKTAGRWHGPLKKIFPVVLLPLTVILILGAKLPLWFSITWQFLSFFVMALYCHLELAVRRPAPTHLTAFYFWLSFGGVLGGSFNALIAPLVFKTPVEYQAAIVMACIVRMGIADIRFLLRRWFYSIIPLCVGVLCLIITGLIYFEKHPAPPLTVVIFFTLWLGAGFLLYRFKPLRLALSVIGILYLGTLPFRLPGYVDVERSYFGVHRIKNLPKLNMRKYLNGNTLHGLQSLDPQRAGVPSAYYHPSGPAGQIFEIFHQSTPPRQAGLIGLGIGSLAAYGKPGERLTFYEIDPVVYKIASNPEYFTYLSHTAAQTRVILGDGRLSIAEVPDSVFNLIVIDAFSSDAVPVHLITREALRLYLDKLTPEGFLAFHISNRHLNLEGVLARGAKNLGLWCLSQNDVVDFNDRETVRSGKQTSHWVVMGRTGTPAARLKEDPRWQNAETGSGNQKAWSDDYSNILAALK